MSTNPYDSPRALDAEVKPASAKSLVTLALVSLHISAVLYCLVGLIFPLISNEATLGAIMACFALALAAGVEVVAYGIRKRRFWAWIAGLIIFGIYLPSLFLPLGVLGLWGLLAASSRVEFGVAGSHVRPTPPAG